jgi:hypothetical protein
MCSIGFKSALISVGGSRVITTYSLLFYYGPTALCLDFGRFFSFLIYTKSVGLLELGISPSQGHYLDTEQYKQNKHTQISMPRGGIRTHDPIV